MTGVAFLISLVVSTLVIALLTRNDGATHFGKTAHEWYSAYFEVNAMYQSAYRRNKAYEAMMKMVIESTDKMMYEQPESIRIYFLYLQSQLTDVMEATENPDL